VHCITAGYWNQRIRQATRRNVRSTNPRKNGNSGRASETTKHLDRRGWGDQGQKELLNHAACAGEGIWTKGLCQTSYNLNNGNAGLFFVLRGARRGIHEVTLKEVVRNLNESRVLSKNACNRLHLLSETAINSSDQGRRLRTRHNVGRRWFGSQA